jgi:hypothetical protein
MEDDSVCIHALHDSKFIRDMNILVLIIEVVRTDPIPLILVQGECNLLYVVDGPSTIISNLNTGHRVS